MLIPSPRHTRADLELWAELEAADLIHAARPAVASHVRRSLDAIRAFAVAGPCYASVSWGKDSVVLAHLVALSGLHVPLVNLRINPTRNPHCDDVRDAFLARFPLPYHEGPVDYSTVDPRLPTIEWDRLTYRVWDDGWRAVSRRFGPRYLSGIRAEESFGRRVRMRKFGLGGANAGAPLGWWKLDDIFAYLAREGLPVHPSYAMLGAGRWDRRHIRTAEIGDEKGIERGRREWEREYYGDVLRRLEAGR